MAIVTINFEISQNGYTLKDAIVLPDDHGLTDAQIEVIKQQRFDNWYAVVTAPQVFDVVNHLNTNRNADLHAPHFICNDGTEISIQSLDDIVTSETLFDVRIYEVKEDLLLAEYRLGYDNTYADVPLITIEAVIASHGGVNG